MMTDAKRKKSIERLLEKEDWTEARKLLQEELVSQPENHWLLTQVGVTLYEQRKYRQALKWFHESLQVVADCPLTLWNLAGTLDALGKPAAAIPIYTWLLTSKKTTQDDFCWETEEWSQDLKTDCLYRLGLCFEHSGIADSAEHCYREYINLLLIGMNGSYPLEEAAQKVQKVNPLSPSRQHGKGLRAVINSALRDSGIRSIPAGLRDLSKLSLEELLAS